MAGASSEGDVRINKATVARRVQRNIRGPEGWYWPSSGCGAKAEAIWAKKGASSIQDRRSCECDGIRDSKIDFKNVTRCAVGDSETRSG
jgi:hypothetical protein